MTVELAAAPPAARKAELSVKFGKSRSCAHRHRPTLPKTIGVTLVIGREINPVEGESRRLLLLTPIKSTLADARRIIGFYRLRWTIEQLFRP